MLAAWLDDDDDDDIKAKTDKTSQNTKCKLCVDGEEKFNFIIRKCNLVAHMKYKTRYNFMGKVIQWELCKRIEYDYIYIYIYINIRKKQNPS